MTIGGSEGLGWASGGLMLLALLYPLRKYRVTRIGHQSGWLTVHLLVSIPAVALALWHAGVPRSLNGAFAWSGMALLALSGTAGRWAGARRPDLLPVWTAVHVPLPYLVVLAVVAHAVSRYAY